MLLIFNWFLLSVITEVTVREAGKGRKTVLGEGTITTNEIDLTNVVPGRTPAIKTVSQTYTQNIYKYNDGNMMSNDPQLANEEIEISGDLYTEEISTKKLPSITPKVTVEQQLGKSNFTLTGSASLNEVNAGVRYRFGGGKNK